MDPIQKRELKRQAWMRLSAQRRRAGLLRGRVVVLSLLCFAVLWGIVFVQMATGNDPVLSAKEKATTRTVASAKRQVETTDPRELEPRQGHRAKQGTGGEEGEAGAEAEELAAAEAEAIETGEIEAGEIEATETEAAEIEAAEIEAAAARASPPRASSRASIATPVPRSRPRR